MAKRAFQVIVLFFAICGFLFVPLGKKTAIEHVQAIVRTPAAQQAASELSSGLGRLVDRLRSRAGESADGDTDALEADVDGATQALPKPRPLKPPSEIKRDKTRVNERKPPETAARAPRQ